MICAEDEIGLGKSHDGILVLPSDAKVGVLAKDRFNIQSDSIFEIGLTPNRSDAASHLGVARDVAAFLRKDFKLPDVSAVGFDDSQNEVKVSIEDEAACPRYTSLTIKGITVKESPEWLKNRLLAIGVRPINKDRKSTRMNSIHYCE